MRDSEKLRSENTEMAAGFEKAQMSFSPTAASRKQIFREVFAEANKLQKLLESPTRRRAETSEAVITALSA